MNSSPIRRPAMPTATEPGSFTFDPASHLYRVGGRAVPSVTQILAARGLYKGCEHCTEESRERGKAVHSAIHFLDEGDLDKATVDPRIEPYLRAYEKFMRECRVETLVNETALMSAKWGFAGRFDRLAWIFDELT